MKKPEVFSYHDHMQFLRDWISYLKSEYPEFSLRKIAQDSQVATGYLPMVLSGKRVLSEKGFKKILPNLQLKKNEIQYLEYLWTLAKSNKQEDRFQALSRLPKFKGFKENNRSEVEVHRYLKKWFYVCIREMCMMKDFKNDPIWIQSQIRERIPLIEIENALKFLIKHQFVEVTKEGSLKVTDRHIECKLEIFKLSLAHFHCEVLELAKQAIQKVPRENRLVTGITAAIRKEDFHLVQEILTDALDKIRTLSAIGDDQNSVYHIELAAFPMTVIGKE